jgi:hypothetical protein
MMWATAEAVGEDWRDQGNPKRILENFGGLKVGLVMFMMLIH